jgi:hypothetical protein
MKLVLVLAGAAIALFLVDRLALWAESHGWIYWRRSKRTGSAGGDILLDLNVFADPGAKHVIEVKQAEPMVEKTDDDIAPPLASKRPPG